MTQEEKAKAYDGLIERLKDLKFAYRFSLLSDAIEEKFPELCESEDERMVKFIKKQLFNIKKTITDNYKLDTELTKAIDWLEAKCEQKFAEWTEEDENVRLRLINYLSGDSHLSKDREDGINWLKSLKERYTWKPSEEQMKALEHAINCYSGISPTNNREVYALEIMKEQLKKLMEE